jgi:dipeptidyl aminopeptidase B
MLSWLCASRLVSIPPPVLAVWAGLAWSVIARTRTIYLLCVSLLEALSASVASPCFQYSSLNPCNGDTRPEGHPCSTSEHPPPSAMGLDSTAEEHEPLTQHDSTATPSTRTSNDHYPRGSISSASTTSLVLENLNEQTVPLAFNKPAHHFEYHDNDEDDDPELPRYMAPAGQRMSRNLRRGIWIVCVVALTGWALALLLFLIRGRYKHDSLSAYDHESPMKSSGKKVTLDQIRKGQWVPVRHEISWISGPNGEDGLLLERDQQGKDFLVVEDIRSRSADAQAASSRTLMKSGWFKIYGQNIWSEETWPSPDLKKVLIASNTKKNFRHSFTGDYYIFDVAKQEAEPLDPSNTDGRVQLAQWAPTSDSVVFTRDNNLFLRIISSGAVRQITKDGGTNYFYGIPDWVYEEEVFTGRIATWWSHNGQFVAFLATNETGVPEYPVQYFVSRPSGTVPKPGEENYPEVRQIKYPKAGAPNPVVDLLFYDVERAEVFSVDVSGGFADDDRLITEVFWADKDQVLIRESNRESDVTRLLLVDASSRSGKMVRQLDVAKLDGGWFTPRHNTLFIPADPANGRPESGYIDTVIYENHNHMAYFTPLDSDKPIMLTQGQWDTVSAPSTVDYHHNTVYFTATKEGSTQRHAYSVKLDGNDLKAVVPTDKPAYYDVNFSAAGGYMLVNYDGPGIPSQTIQSTPSNADMFKYVLETNEELASMASSHELPHNIYSTVTIDNFTLNVVERRPPHFDPSRKYAVLFHLYGGPGSQTVSHRFTVDFQAHVASSLDYLVVTVDGRGTGYIGRDAQVIIRGNLGHYEAIDQIETAKIWAKKPYVDKDRMAIWGWSYGGFMTLKTLEMDAGQTFKYGMAVAPVTDWRFYDSVYTERYMRTPQNNAAGYQSSAITNVTALSQNVRWLMMHGVADDNVHMQSTLTLVDKLDLAGVENYDMRMFPDSDHSIYFHNANKIVYDSLARWLVNAFNGEWYRTQEPVPLTFYRAVKRWIGRS